MRAKFVNENITHFKKPNSEEDFKKNLDIGYGNKPKFKAWKVLEFIRSKGEEGIGLQEIQEYIYFDLNKAPYGKDWFYEKDPIKYYSGVKYGGGRQSRGYWCTNLYGANSRWSESSGLLTKYCHKNKNGKWVLDRMPKPGENIF